MLKKTIIAASFLIGFASAYAEVEPPHSDLFHRSYHAVAGFKVNHLESRTRVRGVSIHAWKKVFKHDFEKKLKRAPSEALIQEQESKLDQILRRVVLKYTSDEEGKVYPIEIDSKDLSEVKISSFKPIQSDRIDFEYGFAEYKNLILCSDGYCFFPVIFTRSMGADLQWNPHYVKIGGKKRRVLSVFECENFKSPRTLLFTFKTPDVEFYSYREFLFLAKIEKDHLQIKEGRLNLYDPSP